MLLPRCRAGQREWGGQAAEADRYGCHVGNHRLLNLDRVSRRPKLVILNSIVQRVVCRRSTEFIRANARPNLIFDPAESFPPQPEGDLLGACLFG
jgi:hypothetical protein